MNRTFSTLLWLLAFLALSSAIWATEAVPPAYDSARDFERVFRVDVPQSGALHRIYLTEALYRCLKQSSGRDLAIFDAQGEAVPFLVRDIKTMEGYPSASDAARTNVQSFPVRTFPLPRNADVSSPLTDVTIQSGSDGQIIEVRTQNASTPRLPAQKGRFLLDMSLIPLREIDADDSAVYHLNFDLQNVGNVVANVTVQSSSDLKNWQILAKGASLILLRDGDSAIESCYVEIGRPQRYLLLEIDGIDAANVPLALTVTWTKRSRGVPLETSEFPGMRESASAAIIYDLEGVFPLVAVNFPLEVPGIRPVTVESAAEKDAEFWLGQGQLNLSLVKSGSKLRRNAPLAVSPRGHRYWKIVPVGVSLPEIPSMSIIWRPQEALFLAQGTPPYYLCVGNGALRHTLQRPDLLSGIVGEIAPGEIVVASVASPADPSVFGAAETETVPAQQEDTQWKTYLVWGILVCGALFLSWIAWSLMQKKDA